MTRRALLLFLTVASVASPALAAFELVPSRQPVPPPAAISAEPAASPSPVSAPLPLSLLPAPAPPPPTGGATPGAGPPSAETLERGVVRGAGRDLPLRQVLRQIVPPGVMVAPLAPDLAETRVSYSGNGRPWREVLSATLTAAGLVARQEGSTLILARAPVPSATAAPAATPSAPAPIWRLERGASLRDTVNRWAAAAGYRVTPDDPATPEPTDWTITVSDTIQADFATALDRLCQGFAETPIPPRVILYTNQTLRIVTP